MREVPGRIFDELFELLGIERRDVGRIVIEPSGIIRIQHFLRNEDGKFFVVNTKTGEPLKPGQYQTWHRDRDGKIVPDVEVDAAQEMVVAKIVWDKVNA